MTAPRVGIFAFGTAPVNHMAPQRARALLAEAALQDVDLIFFAATDCDIDSGLVSASRWRLSGWERQSLPLPAIVVVINDPIWPYERQIGEWLRTQTTVVADHGPSKTELATILSGSAFARYLISERRLSATNFSSELSDWLLEHGASVVKPANGMRGGGVRRLEPTNGIWRLRYRDSSSEGTLGEIIGHIAGSLASRLRYREYVVQRYIDSTTEDGRAAALRVDLHKRAEGGWAVVKDFARIGEVGRVVSNLARGGYQGSAMGFLSRRSRRPAAEIQAELLSLACDVAAQIDASPGASITELGVDVLIDPSDRLWLLEANIHADSPTTEHDRAVHVISYLRSLAG